MLCTAQARLPVSCNYYNSLSWSLVAVAEHLQTPIEVQMKAGWPGVGGLTWVQAVLWAGQPVTNWEAAGNVGLEADCMGTCVSDLQHHH